MKESKIANCTVMENTKCEAGEGYFHSFSRCSKSTLPGGILQLYQRIVTEPFLVDCMHYPYLLNGFCYVLYYIIT